MNQKRIIFSAAMAAASIFAAQPSFAQTNLVAPSPETGVSLEASRPHFKDFDLTLPTSIWNLSGRLAINPAFSVVADLPFAHAGFDGDVAGSPDASNVFGNPYLGMEYRPMSRVMVELGFRAPLTTADENSYADVIGFLGEPQRGEAFLEDALPLTGAVTFEQPFDNGLALRARGGVTSILYTGDEDDVDTSTVLDYGLFGNYDAGMARFGAGVSGRWFASADEGSFTDNSLHQLALTVDGPVGRVRPGLSVRVPLDKNHRDIMDYSIGAYLQVPLR